jgi:hypothetical protein
MPAGPLHGRGDGATGPRHAGQAFIHAVRKMACAESSCGHDGQEVQQFCEFSQFMGHLIGQAFKQSSTLTRVSRNCLRTITICDLGHTLSGADPLMAKLFGTISAGQAVF